MTSNCKWHRRQPVKGFSKQPDKGSALLMVLWLTAALSAVGIAVASNVRGETQRTETNIDDARAYFLARGAVERSALHMIWSRAYRSDDGLPMYHINGDPSMDLTFPAGDVHVEVIPESSKLNVNAIRPEFMMRLLAALGVPEDRATGITAAIVDWRLPRSANPGAPLSPFDAFYLTQSPSFTAPHTSFHENEELLLVEGMTPELYYGNDLDAGRPGLRDCLTVYGSAFGVDINTAQRPTLEAIGVDPADADRIATIRKQHPITDFRELQDIVESLGPAGRMLMIGGQSMYTLRATARLRQPDGRLSDLRRTVAALVKIGGSKPGGFDVVRWFDRA